MSGFSTRTGPSTLRAKESRRAGSVYASAYFGKNRGKIERVQRVVILRAFFVQPPQHKRTCVVGFRNQPEMHRTRCALAAFSSNYSKSGNTVEREVIYTGQETVEADGVTLNKTIYLGIMIDLVRLVRVIL